MSKFKSQLEEDRALRNAARKLFRNELAHVSKEVKPAALGERLADNVGRRVDTASDGAIEFAENHGGKIATAGGAVLAGIGLWLARKPILARLFSAGEAGPADTGEDESFADEELAR